MTAKPDDWKRLPFGEMLSIPYTARFNTEQFAKLSEGLIPKAMEDKWFVYLENCCLHFHRSWTGQGVYRISLTPSDESYCVTGAQCVNEILEKTGDGYQAELLDFLVSNLLLGETKPFPRPAGIEQQLPGLFQHAISGAGYQEKEIPQKHWWKFWR
jgi:hypothetical protein